MYTGYGSLTHTSNGTSVENVQAVLYSKYKCQMLHMSPKEMIDISIAQVDIQCALFGCPAQS
jgi:hypothetical protein